MKRAKQTRKFTKPDKKRGATRFTGDVNNPVFLINTLRQTRWLSRGLEAQTRDLKKVWGRRRTAGDWAYILLASLEHPRPDIFPFWENSSDDVWKAAGFDTTHKRPKYPTTWERLTELEDVAEAFEKAAHTLIRHCRRHEPRIGLHVHVDGTESVSHARARHACPPGTCGWHDGSWESNEAVLSVQSQSVSSEEARHRRQKDDSAGFEHEPAPQRIAVHKLGRSRWSTLYRLKTKNHEWLTFDADAGIRSYEKEKKHWHGHYNQKATDHLTGAPLAVRVHNAATVEQHQYAEMLDYVKRALNTPTAVRRAGSDLELALPEVVAFDKGFAFRHVFEHNTRRGIHTVAPWRKVGGLEEPKSDELRDAHGVVHCKYCKGPTRRLELRLDGNPRLIVKCLLGGPPGSPCEEKRQSVPCERDWLLLTPLSQLDPIHIEMRVTHSEYERVHRLWRNRYDVAGDDVDSRTKRLGRDWQQLRANAALLLEWLKIAVVNGWLGSAKYDPTAEPERYFVGQAFDDLQERIANALAQMLATRAKRGLDLPWQPPPEPDGGG